jgi:Domain of unknown function (DUF4398)
VVDGRCLVRQLQDYIILLMSSAFEIMRELMRRPRALFQACTVASLILLSGLENSGCSTGTPPTDALAQAEMGLRAANEARAADIAPMDLQNAREKLEASRQAMAAKRYEEARRLAESAQVEAELAEVKAEAEIMRQAAEGLRKGIEALRVQAELGSKK